MKRLVAPLLLLGLVLLGTLARVQTALEHPSFDAEDPVGMLQSDPGLLYYLTSRVLAADGLVPDDWRADPRIEHPATVDVPARFTVGLEWIVRGAHAWAGGELPLHVLCLWVTGFLASLTVLGVYLAAAELCGARGWGVFAALLWAVLPASYRTIGFVLVREDLSLPFFALHVGLALRAARTGGVASGALAGAALGLAVGTWHAAGPFAALVAAAMLLVFLARGTNPFAHRAGRAGAVAYLLLALAVPALRAKGAALAPAACVAVGLWVASSPRLATPRARRSAALAGVAVAFAASVALGVALGAGEDLRHVVRLVLAKVSYFGLRPADPRPLDFEVRMMWQGPFATTGAREARAGFGFTLLAVPPLLLWGTWAWQRGKLTAAEAVAHLLFFFACFGAWLVVRVQVLAALVLPVLVARGFQLSGKPAGEGGSRSVAPALGAIALLFLQLVAFGSWLAKHPLPWHSPARRDGLRAMVAAVEEHVPPDAAVVADFMSSTAILAHTGRPICVQPKWESAASRARVRAFWDAFYAWTPEDLRRLVTEEWDADYLLVDRFTLGTLRASRYLAGLRGNEAPPPESAAAALLAPDAAPPAGYERLAGDAAFTLYRLRER